MVFVFQPVLHQRKKMAFTFMKFLIVELANENLKHLNQTLN